MVMLQAEHQSGLLGFKVGNRRRESKDDSDGHSIVSNISPKGAFIRKFASGRSEPDDFNSKSENYAQQEFLIECQNGEMVFVAEPQGRLLLHKCKHFKDLLDDSAKQGDGMMIRKPEWPASLVRRVIELITTGATWITNDATAFSELDKTCYDLSIDLRLASLINNHDILTKASTRKLFSLLNIEKCQFKIRAAVKSSEWVQLLNSNILLMSNSRVLHLKLADFHNEKSKRDEPSSERLKKCDTISSDFCVYGEGNMQSLLAITNILSPPKTAKQMHSQLTQREEIKLVIKVRRSSLSHELMNTFWRMTDTSFVVSSDDDAKFMESFQVEDGVAASPKGKDSEKKENDTTSTAASSIHASVPDQIEINEEVSNVGGNRSMISKSVKVFGNESSASSSVSDEGDFQYRTITATSFLVLKHLFEPINLQDPSFCASLVVKAATPDTIGRLINATQRTSIPRLDFDLASNIYFACKTSQEIKVMLDYLSDYASSAVIKGDFQLCQRT